MLEKIAAAVTGVAAVALIGTPAASADTYDDMFNAVDWLAGKYGVSAWVGVEPMEYGTYAKTRGDEITFNTLYVANPGLLRESLVNDVSRGYHRGGNCTPAQLVAAHEYAHVLDNATGGSTRVELIVAIANGLSGEVAGYSFNDDGSVNYPEAIAAAFTAVECDSPNQVELAIYNMLTT